MKKSRVKRGHRTIKNSRLVSYNKHEPSYLVLHWSGREECPIILVGSGHLHFYILEDAERFALPLTSSAVPHVDSDR